jgi:hypothetical protein
MINIAEFAALFHREISSVATLEQIQKDLMAGLDRAGTPYITPAENATMVFIKRAREVHGDRYGYDEVVYVTSMDKVRIICKRHGLFEQVANSHVHGSGCPKCARKYRQSTEEFIAQARAVHGGRYWYDEAVYVNSKTKVGITCREHGRFEMRPDGHLKGRGCPRCAKNGAKVRGYARYAKSRSSNTEEFIAKARKVHGDRYNYDEVVYVTNKDKVRITCHEHGVFEQAANSHLKGRGCQKCSGNRSLNTEDLIAKAKKVHGDRYGYDEVVYVNSATKVRIICKEHGVFEQAPVRHARGQGCPKCGGRLRQSTEEFIAKAREVHGDRYKYDEVVYVNVANKVRIICPEHGVFEQFPKDHLKGHGCRRCAGRHQVTTEEFTAKARKVHGDRYGYDEVVYVRGDANVRITCREHGVFEQAPSNHLSGHNCPVCAGSRQSTTGEFIARAAGVHGDRYNYDEVVYVNRKTKVRITCREHGVFEQVANDHLKGRGCPRCGAAKSIAANKRRAKSSPA